VSPFWRYALLALLAVVLLRAMGAAPSLAHGRVPVSAPAGVSP